MLCILKLRGICTPTLLDGLVWDKEKMDGWLLVEAGCAEHELEVDRLLLGTFRESDCAISKSKFELGHGGSITQGRSFVIG